MQIQPVSCIADFMGNNPNFRNKLVEQEKDLPNGGRTFEEILQDARRKLNNGAITANRM